MSAKRAKAARRIARQFAPRFDQSFDLQKPPRYPIRIRLLSWLVPSIKTKFEQRWKAEMAPKNKAYKHSSLKMMAHSAAKMMRGKSLR